MTRMQELETGREAFTLVQQQPSTPPADSYRKRTSELETGREASTLAR